MHRDLNVKTQKIIECSINVHKELGPGLLESTYEACLEYELLKKDLKVERQKELPVIYKGIEINCGYRIDLLVEDLIIVELKSIDRVEPIHIAQILTYMKLSKRQLGLLINFNVKLLKTGIKRIIL